MNMMKWMLIGCLGVLLLVFVLPLFGIEGIAGYSGWLFFGLILLACLLPMLMMNRKKDNTNREDKS
jgi:magnesium-transporting ATPase (P-type)